MNNSLNNMQKLKAVAARLTATAFLTALFTIAPLQTAFAQAAPSLGTAQTFAVLGGSTVTNTGPTIVVGDLGVSPGTAITGFPPGTVTGGTIHAADAVALQAQADTTAAYIDLAGRACDTTFGVPTDLAGMTLVPGVYCFSSSASLTGALTLDGGGNVDAVWIFKVGSTLITGAIHRYFSLMADNNAMIFGRLAARPPSVRELRSLEIFWRSRASAF